MKLTMYQIDAFAQKVFEGNPAAVIPLNEWIEDELMQKIAMENNLSETVFFVKEQEKYHIRWFTPKAEVDMCGHATLASAYVIFEELNEQENEIVFSSKSGDLIVKKEKDGLLSMDFPIQKINQCETPQQIIDSFAQKPIACYKSMDYIVIFEDEKDIVDAQPNLEVLKSLDARGVCIASVSQKYDFVTRFFAPKYGINEDPVTGSTFTQLVPYFSKTLDSDKFSCKQLSPRGGEVFCKLKEDRVEISGFCMKFLEATIEIL